MHELNQFPSRDSLDSALAERVAELLAVAINQKGHASIAVSGGSTPKGFFKALANKPLDWSKVVVTLADERWVEADDAASNTTLVKANLLQQQAAKARFFELKRQGELNDSVLSVLNVEAQTSVLPLDVLILGMGEDGHTASLFPCSEQLSAAMADDAPALLKTIPTTAPHERITFSRSALSQSGTIFLHICGQGKQTVLDQALAEQDCLQMPIRAFLHHPSLVTHIYWAE